MLLHRYREAGLRFIQKLLAGSSGQQTFKRCLFRALRLHDRLHILTRTGLDACQGFQPRKLILLSSKSS